MQIDTFVQLYNLAEIAGLFPFPDVCCPLSTFRLSEAQTIGDVQHTFYFRQQLNIDVQAVREDSSVNLFSRVREHSSFN